MSPALVTPDVEAIFRFNNPDLSIGPNDRAFVYCDQFANAAPKNVREVRLPLHDIRAATDLPPAPECLDEHGFAMVQHLMPESAWATAENIESTYIPAVSTLVKSITGCKTVLVNNVAFRRRPVNQQADPKFYHKAGGELDNLARSIPTDRYFVMPSEPSKTIEPARGMHIDYTLRGLRSTIRHCRADFASAGAAHLAALDTPDSSTRGPRVAAYSVWRPLKPVTRDPIAVLDFKTASPAHWTPFDYRSPGYQGDYLLEACAINAPEEGDERVQKWYYVSEQQPDEVMLIKFADSESEVDPKVAVGCGHGSPEVVGQYGDTRESVEARVLAFW